MKMVNKSARGIIISLGVFVGLFFALTALLYITEFIPQKAMKAHMKESADYLNSNPDYYLLEKKNPASWIDHYADAILLGISYETDAEEPLKALVISAYYENGSRSRSLDLKDCIEQDLEPNQEYLRYWHGTAIFVRLFHLVTDIRGMYVVFGSLLVILNIALMYLFVKCNMKEAIAALLLGEIGVSIWYVPFSLEYIWMFLVALIASIVVLCLQRKDKQSQIKVAFLVIGMVTIFLDFFTTETLTLTIPMLCLLTYMKKEAAGKNGNVRKNGQDGKKLIRVTLENSACWAVGYIGMWLCKWGLSALVLKRNVMPYISGHITQRMGTDTKIGETNMIKTMFRNVNCLFPMNYGSGFRIAAGVLLVVLICFLIVYKKKDVSMHYVAAICGMAILPWLRFMILENHSYLHFMFTYRAQLSTLMALVLLVAEITDWRIFIRGKK